MCSQFGQNLHQYGKKDEVFLNNICLLMYLDNPLTVNFIIWGLAIVFNTELTILTLTNKI